MEPVYILIFLSGKNEGADQTARMRGLVCAFVVRMLQSHVFTQRGPNDAEEGHIHLTLCKLGIFKILFLVALLLFQNIIRVPNYWDPYQDRRFVGPDLDPICLHNGYQG